MLTLTLTAYNQAPKIGALASHTETRTAVTLRFSLRLGGHVYKTTGCILQVSESRYRVCVPAHNKKQLVSFTYDSLKEAKKEARALLILAAQAKREAHTKNFLLT